MPEEYIQIDLKIILAGLISGIIASLWTIIPFFVAGIANLLYITIISGVVLLFVLTSFKKDKLLKSGVLAVITFLVISYLAVPFVSGLLFSTNANFSQTNSEGLATLSLKVPNMFCQGCAYSVGSALKGIPGVVDAKVDLDTKIAVVSYDPSVVSPETILSNDVIQAYGGYVE